MKRRTSTMTKIVLLISFIILFGRLLYSSIGAISHHQDKRAEAIEQSQSLPASQDKAP
ncbi:YfgG family protein [Enterobacillus tribolii]|uniref:YfgG family protein n=1 Tax=Enterobacillus tribolii TaxID=1487935 RepID=UPI0018AD47F0|nr:YfgG family protein [Enterobacillus tribolii]